MDKRKEHHTARLYLEELALGLTGTIGDRVSFSLVPSLQSKVFVAGLEVGYSFGGGVGETSESTAQHSRNQRIPSSRARARARNS